MNTTDLTWAARCLTQIGTTDAGGIVVGPQGWGILQDALRVTPVKLPTGFVPRAVEAIEVFREAQRGDSNEAECAAGALLENLLVEVVRLADPNVVIRYFESAEDLLS